MFFLFLCANKCIHACVVHAYMCICSHVTEWRPEAEAWYLHWWQLYLWVSSYWTSHPLTSLSLEYILPNSMSTFHFTGIAEAKHHACQELLLGGRWDPNSHPDTYVANSLSNEPPPHGLCFPGVYTIKCCFPSGGKLFILRHLLSVHFWSYNF